MTEKIVICRPRGGLNDMLVQIEKCWRYASEHRRILYIDSTRSGLLDGMGNYFNEPDGVRYGVPEGRLQSSFVPAEISDLSLNYRVAWSGERGNFTLKDTGSLIAFNFQEDYEEEVLVHEQCGGGRESLDALRKLELRPHIASSIRQIIDELDDFEAIHVRNTDYKTDYKRFFETISFAGGRKVVLCTDDLRCQEYAKDLWRDRLIIPNAAPKTDGSPLHMNPQLDRRSTNIAAITDLVLLASSSKLHYTKLDRGFISGFTRLALDLQANPSVIEALLGGQK